MLDVNTNKTNQFKKYHTGVLEPVVNANKNISTNTNACSSSKAIYESSSLNQETLPLQTTPAISCTTYTPPLPPQTSSTQTTHHQLKLDLDKELCKHANTDDLLQLDNDTECSVKKRNVNWHSPIHKYATTSTQEKQQQTSPQSISTTSSTHTSQIGDNSSISSGSTSVSPTKTVRIDECVQEFYDDLINRTTEPITTNSESPAPHQRGGILNIRRTLGGEDDGFESLNGKSSSGEDTNASPHAPKNQLRLRLNTLDSHQRVLQLNEVRDFPVISLRNMMMN